MKVHALIELLRYCNQNAEVTAFDADSEAFEPVTGLIHDDNDVVELHTDDIS